MWVLRIKPGPWTRAAGALSQLLSFLCSPLTQVLNPVLPTIPTPVYSSESSKVPVAPQSCVCHFASLSAASSSCLVSAKPPLSEPIGHRYLPLSTAP